MPPHHLIIRLRECAQMPIEAQRAPAHPRLWRIDETTRELLGKIVGARTAEHPRPKIRHGREGGSCRRTLARRERLRLGSAVVEGDHGGCGCGRRRRGVARSRLGCWACERATRARQLRGWVRELPRLIAVIAKVHQLKTIPMQLLKAKGRSFWYTARPPEAPRI